MKRLKFTDRIVMLLLAAERTMSAKEVARALGHRSSRKVRNAMLHCRRVEHVGKGKYRAALTAIQKNLLPE